MNLFFKVLCLILFNVISLTTLQANQDSILTYQLTKDTVAFSFYNHEIIIESNQSFDIHEILSIQKSNFKRYKRSELQNTSSNVWARIRLTNSYEKIINGYLNFRPIADSITLYTVIDGNVISKKEVTNLDNNDNNDPRTSYALEVNETKTYYIKFYNNKEVPIKSLISFRAVSYNKVIDIIKKRFSWYFLYVGVLLLIAIFSLFYFQIFRERIFLYFSAMMLSFIIYSGGQDFIFADYYTSGTIITCALIGIIFFSYFFIEDFLNLKDNLPKFSKIFRYFSVLTITSLVPFIINRNFSISLFNSNSQNLLTVTWILMILYATIKLSRNQNSQAKILLKSTVVLLLGSIIFIAFGLGLLPQNVFTVNIMKIGSALFSSFLFINLFDKISTINSEKKQIQELDKLKSRFYANITHEFRTPLTLLLGPLKQLFEKENNTEKKDIIVRAQTNANRILTLINQLLSLSKLEAGKMPLKIINADIVSFIRRLTLSFESLAKTKNVQLNFQSEKKSNILFFDKEKIEDIINNILSNAFKFTKEGDEISVVIVDHKNSIDVIIKDTGQGISSEVLPHIFNRYFQEESETEHKIPGSGIGLAIVKELIDLHKATINVESELDKGTTFKINFLKGHAHFQDIKIHKDQGASLERVQEVKSTHKEALNLTYKTQDSISQMILDTTILIVEDNDEIRSYIKTNLEKSYKIIEAKNGEEGFNLATEQIPDIIISDIMMPVLDGYALSKKLKAEKRTSHIPIILLTAKASQRDKIEGLQTGAEDYLIKPFDPLELQLRVRNTLINRNKMRVYLDDHSQIKPAINKLSELDRNFIAAVLDSINMNISNVNFNVEDLARSTGISRSQLNRKLNALTNTTANKLIQTQRLIKALDMLKKKQGNVSEISFESGFSSTAYFIKCFKDKYGITPGELL